MSEAHRHGGALDAAVLRYGGARANWLDLSTGINPAPEPLPPLPQDLWTRLPEASLDLAAIEAARACYGAPPDAGIVAAPGSQALISALPHLFAPTRAAVLEPTYGEHRLGLEAAGHRVASLADLRDVPEEVRLLVLVNPNNPDGRRHAAADLLTLAGRLAKREGLLVVDEAFADADPADSLCPHAGRQGLFIHRSFGKAFGYAGIRLGFGLGPPDLTARLAQRLGPWATSGPALALGAAFLGDAERIARMRAEIARQSDLLRQTLGGAGLAIEGSTGLFALVHHPLAPALFEALCRRHILTRPFAYRPDWLRFGTVASQADAARLSAALASALAETAR